MDEQFLTVEEVAKTLNKAPFTVRRLLRNGHLPGYKLGKGQWMIKKSDLQQYLEREAKYHKPEER